jgi:Flp pilus assembly protein TadG
MRRLIALLRRLSCDDQGGAAVEAAIIGPMILFLAMGLVEMGRYADKSILVANAARAGVQYGTVNLSSAFDNTGMQNAALADGERLTGLTAVATHVCQCSDGSASTCAAGDCPYPLHRIVWVQVDTTGTFTSLINYPGVPQSLTIRGHALMRTGQ